MTESSQNLSKSALPQGTVTLLFTDIQGSTKLLRKLGTSYGPTLGTHRRLLRTAFAAGSGVEVDTQGDAFFFAFRSADEAVRAAVASQRAHLSHEWSHGEPVMVRMGIHSGHPTVIDDNYVGIDVHRAARICGAAHGGQILLSQATAGILSTAGDGDLHLRELGVHRLKDLEHPESLFQVEARDLPTDFPPPSTLVPPTNIPSYASSLIGRVVELQDIEEMLGQDAVRLVTVTGPGGTGKTRLAAALALDILDDFPNGAFFVDLSRAQSDAVAAEIADSLGVSIDGSPSTVSALVDHLSAMRILLVLDNFEQAVEAASLVAELLQRCPMLTMIVTSRVPLAIDGEHQYALEPLGLPASSTKAIVERSEAAQLFVERAAAVRKGFAVTVDNASAVAEICRLLDGLPLAIELAAARVKLFSPQALLDRLGDRLKLLTGGRSDSPVRHRALRTTIDWSYDLLSPQERAFFRDLAVFSGGAAFEAVERVLGMDDDALDLLTRLIDHSLVRQHEGLAGDVRFWMLATIREYSLELLESSDSRADLRARHAAYFLSFAEEASDERADRKTPAPDLEVEHDNMRSALAWFIKRAEAGSENDALLGLRLASALGRFWYTHGHAVEGSAWLEQTLALNSSAPIEPRARGLWLLGILMEQRRELSTAAQLFDQALALYRDSGDRVGEAACLNSLGVVARCEHDFERAEELLTASVAIRRDLGNRLETSTALNNLGIVALDRGDLDMAQRLFEEIIPLDLARGDDWGVTCTRASLSVVHLQRGVLELARPMMFDVMQAFVDLGDLDGASDAMEALAGLAAHEGQPLRAARVAGAADCLRRRLGIPLASVDRLRLDRCLERPRDELGQERFSDAWAEGAEMTTEQAIDYTLERMPSREIGPAPTT